MAEKSQQEESSALETMNVDMIFSLVESGAMKEADLKKKATKKVLRANSADVLVTPKPKPILESPQFFFGGWGDR